MERVCKECARSLQTSQRRGNDEQASASCYHCESVRFHEKCGKVSRDGQFRCLSCDKDLETKMKKKERKEQLAKNKTEKEKFDNDKPCLACGSRESEEYNLMFICDNCEKGQHQLCIRKVVVPNEDEDHEWACDECFVNCGNCIVERCGLKKECNLSKLMECIKCRKSFHYSCLGLIAIQFDFTCQSCSKENLPVSQEESAEQEEIESDFATEETAQTRQISNKRRRTSTPNTSNNQPIAEFTLPRDAHATLLAEHTYPIVHCHNFGKKSADTMKWPDTGIKAYKNFVKKFAFAFNEESLTEQ
jgi:hypothetical protein